MKKAVLTTNDFNRLIYTTRDFITPVGKPCYRYIKLDVDAEKQRITAAACDGYKLSVERAPCEADESFSLYIKPIAKLPTKEQVTIELLGKDVLIRCAGNIIGFEQPELKDPFMNYEQFFKEKECAFRIGFDPRLLMQTVSAARTSIGQGQVAILEFMGPRDPVFIRDKKGDNLRMVLPVRIKEDTAE